MLIMKVTDLDEPCDRVGLPPPDLEALQASAAKACALLKVLAHTDRLVLLCRLAQGEFCVSELESDLGIRQPTLSQQLGAPRRLGGYTPRGQAHLLPLDQ